MAIFAKYKEGGSFQSVAPGTYIGRCFSVIDMGTYSTEYQGKKRDRHELRITWEIPDEVIQTDRGPAPAIIGKTYTLSLHKESSLRQDLAAWRGRDFTEDELKCFDVAKLLGAPCVLTIAEKQHQDGAIKSVVAGVGKLGKGMTCSPAFNKPLEYGVELGKACDAYMALPEWLKKKMEACHEFTKPAPDVEAPAENVTPVENDDVPF